MHHDCIVALALGAWQFTKAEPNRQSLMKLARAVAGEEEKPRFVFPSW
jgi:hypothetical protein